ncbi:MAG TPA: hypothetical protein VGL56_18790 [Fimbriimonadaceae bacterium]|jgi:hypothetical protein
MHKFWAVKSRLEIPLEHVINATIAPEDAKSWWHGWKMMGTDVPGVFAAGLFRFHGKWVFWDVTNPDYAISISLRDELYNELLIEVEDPAAAVDLIRRSLTPRLD